MKLKRPVILCMLIGAGLGLVATDFAAAQPFPFPPRPGGGGRLAPRIRSGAVKRAPVLVPNNWPLKRSPRAVIVRERQGGGHVRVAPRVFLPTIVFGGAVVTRRYERGYRHDDDRRYGYSRESLVWEDSETLYGEDEWTEFTLDCNSRGAKLWFEVLDGRIQADWAEVVFDNGEVHDRGEVRESGEVQVVEFPERTLSPGIYQLLDFRDGRRVEYVRMVAKAASREARVRLWMER